MLVHLKVKLAEVVDGVDLTHFDEGDVIELSEADGQLLLAEGWAESVPKEERVSSFRKTRAIAAERSARPKRGA